MTPNLLDLATNHKVVKTQTEASIAELLLPARHRTISRFLITKHFSVPTVMNITA
jgi:hypothetical protein